MKKILVSAAVIVGFVVYVISQRFGDKDEKPITHNSYSLTPSSVEPSSSPVATVANTPKSNGQYKDGTYTSKVADAIYGPLQISVVISGGKISDIKFLQFPNDRENSRQISSSSTPVLKQEAIRAQSAKVDVVSGATQTSEAFIDALGTTLALAK